MADSNCLDQAASRMNLRLLKGFGHLSAPGWRLSSRMRRFRYCFQSLGRTNEPKVSWFDGFGFARMQARDDVHLVKLLLFECSALGLHFAELL